MNNDLGFWRKLMLSLTNTPKTDEDIAWLYRKLARPEIPASALWDAEKGANERKSQLDALYDGFGGNLDLERQRAIQNRGWGLDQTEKDMPTWTPTHRYMEQLLNPDMLIVPKKEDMNDFWK